ncbi:MAG: 50S ribosomal protein L9 [Candidatus Peribacteraceae bacterium]|jgi:large subunit ribosomal protein L9|nr:50S ribosomal protein L9 [Candidatus Peribacteraceae bacterium]MDP7454294.1 50S ribosomal protein L9 [Candidatus Peribacteraceae bacterium]MDP7645666.1 50S ribosomal protein L9 [Candidatus Peribacteraceae bacterium]|tara:strand:- start:91 stop:537 length:447 start_codon:yes stop_codon:yes gene_type:complete
MEVLLLQDVPKVGQKNDLLMVGDGYALNFLLPQQKAIVATPTVRKRYAEEIRRRAEQKELEKKLETGAAEALAGLSLKFERKVTKAGKLYAAITEKHIVEALKKEHKIDVNEAMVIIAEPIKALGDFDVKLKIGPEEQELKVVVKEEK